ncbi:uncharacterized protein LOC108051877 [Drosophila rhopaloa]|uniref:Uncharacterized protein LOC108051877 n=1 Tax=Drosophila rhopaloa TaxID=1041015 RepID=A0A6P4FI95_DRORH|nr:uncharacterized protein LOC108051877 [Drosophila rhopaloa]
MLLKYFPLLFLAQILIVAAKPTHPVPSNSDDPRRRQAEEETVNLCNSLMRSQITFFTEVKAQLNPQTKRSQDISLYLTQLNALIAEDDLQKKGQMIQNISEEFQGSPLLLNNESETGLSDNQYEDLLRGQKLNEMKTKMKADFTDYFWKMTKLTLRIFG